MTEEELNGIFYLLGEDCVSVDAENAIKRLRAEFKRLQTENMQAVLVAVLALKRAPRRQLVVWPEQLRGLNPRQWGIELVPNPADDGETKVARAFWMGS